MDMSSPVSLPNGTATVAECRSNPSYRVPFSAAELMRARSFEPTTIHTPFGPRRYASLSVSIHSDIGNRKTQEDRFVFCPQLTEGRTDTAFFGVFDGTVGDFASDNVQRLVVPHLVASEPWRQLEQLLKIADSIGESSSTGEDEEDEEAELFHSAVTESKSEDVGGVSTENSSNESTTQDGQDGEHPPHLSCPNKSMSWLEMRPNENKLNDESFCDEKVDTSGAKTTSSSTPAGSPGATSNQDDKSKNKNVSSSSLIMPLSSAKLSRKELEKQIASMLAAAVDTMYLNADTELVALCQKHNRHYASSTSVTVVLAGGYCCIGHLGDSRVALGYERMGMLFGEFLTVDHKPNLPSEQDRIMRNGGSVEYLHNHNNKPFIRGGDFAVRKSRGDQPMQLQYSRAFGGKDLKMFGLSNEPDLRVFKLYPRHHVLIIASDGLWDIHTAAKAVEIVLLARRQGENPAVAVVEAALAEQRARIQNADNVTAMVAFLDGIESGLTPRSDLPTASIGSGPSQTRPNSSETPGP